MAFVLLFDNVAGFQTGVAVANLTGVSGPIAVVIKDDEGAELQTATLTLAARAHTAFVLSSLNAVTLNKRGVVEFRPPTGGQISVLGLRFNPKGAFTTVPVLAR